MYRTRGYSKRAIARALAINRKTVAKVIQEYESSLLCSDPESCLDTLLTRKPVYDSSSRRRKVIAGALQDLIDTCLRNNARKRANGLKKQCMVGIDIYQFVLSKGFKVSYSGVCKYIKEVKNADKPSSKEAFIRGYHPPGESCEFDWGEVKLYIAGKLQRFYMAVFTFSHSNGRYAWLFRHQNTLAFLESHRNFFREVGGSPTMMVYDNMRVAIKEFVGAEKKPTEALLRLSNFYRCHYRFCNARAGWEKGHVERSVEYVRRKAFSILLRFDSLEDAQNQLSTTCSRINTEEGSSSTVGKQAKLGAELAALQPCYNEMGCFELETYKVDKWSTICMKASHYSVPDTLVGKLVDVKIYSEKLVMLYKNQKVAVHGRIYHPADWSVKLEHYLNTLLRKPGAVHGSLALQKMPQGIQQLFERQFSDKSKDFVLLLQYALEHGFTDLDILAAYQDLKNRGLAHVSADQIKTMMHALSEPKENRDEFLHPKINQEQSAGIEDGSLQILSKLSRMMDNYKH
jgi:hypothetical protein